MDIDSLQPPPLDSPVLKRVGKAVIKATGGSVVAIPAWLAGLATTFSSPAQDNALANLPRTGPLPKVTHTGGTSGFEQGRQANIQQRQQRAERESIPGGAISDIGDLAKGFGHLLTTNALSLDSPASESIADAIGKRTTEAYDMGQTMPGQIAGNLQGVFDPSRANSILTQPLTTALNVLGGTNAIGGLAKAGRIGLAESMPRTSAAFGAVEHIATAPKRASGGVATSVKRAVGALPETAQLHAAIDALVSAGRMTPDEAVRFKQFMTPWETAAVMHGATPEVGTGLNMVADVAKGALVGGVMGEDIGLGAQGAAVGSLVGMTPSALRFAPKHLRAKVRRNFGEDPYAQTSPGETEVMRNVASPSISVGKEHEDLAREAGREFGAGSVQFDTQAEPANQPPVEVYVREVTPAGDVVTPPDLAAKRQQLEGHVNALQKSIEVANATLPPEQAKVFADHANDQLNKIKLLPDWNKSLDRAVGLTKENPAAKVQVATTNPAIEQVVDRMHGQHVAAGGEVSRDWFARQVTDVLRAGGKGAHNLLFSERARGFLTEQIVEKAGLTGKAAANFRTALGNELVDRVNRSRLGPEPQSLELRLPNGTVTDIDAELGELASKSKKLLPEFQREASEKLGRTMGLQAAEHSLRSGIKGEVERFFPKDNKFQKPAPNDGSFVGVDTGYPKLPNSPLAIGGPDAVKALGREAPQLEGKAQPAMPALSHEESNWLDAVLGKERKATAALGHEPEPIKYTPEEIDHAQQLLDAIEAARAARVSKDMSPLPERTPGQTLKTGVVGLSDSVIRGLRDKLDAMRAMQKTPIEQMADQHFGEHPLAIAPETGLSVPDELPAEQLHQFDKGTLSNNVREPPPSPPPPEGAIRQTQGGELGFPREKLNSKPVSGKPELYTYATNLANGLEKGSPAPLALPYAPDKLSAALKTVGTPAAIEFAKRLDSGEFTPASSKPIGALLDRAKMSGDFNPKGEGVWLAEGAHDVLNTRASAIEKAQRYEGMLDAIKRGHFANVIHNIAHGYKRGNTILRLPTIAHNLISNDLLSALEHGKAPMQTTWEGLDAAKRMSDYYSGKTPRTPELDRMYRGLSRAGIGGTATLADDISALTSMTQALERNDLSTLSARAANTLNNLGAHVYNKFGDMPVKIGAAQSTFKQIMSELPSLRDGDKYTLELPHNRMVELTKTPKGIEALGEVMPLDSQKLADLVAQESVKHASDLFANPHEIGLAWQKLRQSDAGSVAAPFLTWAAHMMDHPGKEGAISRLLGSTRLRQTTNPQILVQNAKQLGELALRRAALTGTLQGANDHKHEALREVGSWGAGDYATNEVTPTADGKLRVESHAAINPFSPTSLILNGGRGIMAAIVGPGAFSKNMTPQQKRRFEEYAKFQGGKLGTSADALRVMGLSGGALMDSWRDMMASSPRDPVDKRRAALSLAVSLMGGTPTDMLRVASEALSPGNEFSGRKRGPDGELEDYATWGFRTLIGLGARELVAKGKKGEIERYSAAAKQALHAAVIAPLEREKKIVNQQYAKTRTPELSAQYHELSNQSYLLKNLLDKVVAEQKKRMYDEMKK